MIVWRKRGWIVLVLAIFAVGLPLEFIGIYIGLGQLFLFVTFGGWLWYLGNRWNAGQNHYSEAQGGKFHWKDLFEVGAHDEHRTSIFGPELSPSHSLCMIKLQYWGLVFGICGIICFLISLFS